MEGYSNYVKQTTTIQPWHTISKKPQLLLLRLFTKPLCFSYLTTINFCVATKSAAYIRKKYTPLLKLSAFHTTE